MTLTSLPSSCVIEKLLEKPFLESKEALAYFYCSRTSSDTKLQDPRAILLSILRQLAAPFPGLPLKSPIISAYDKEISRGSQEARLSIDEIAALLNELIQNHYENVTLVFDAFDECDARGRLHLLDTFTKLTYNPKTVVKTLFSSRNDPDIESHFSKRPNLSITATDNASDIMSFISKEISQRLLRGRASKQIIERVEVSLNKKANGVFRWVALQVDSLCDPDRVYTEEDVEYLLPKLPETLEDTYAEILDDLERLPAPSRETIKNVLKLLMCAEYPMNVQQILEASAVLSESPQAALDKAIILKMAKGLVVEQGNRHSNILIFTHLSVKEFFEKMVHFSGEYAHSIAAKACLKTYLSPKYKKFETRNFRWYALMHVGRHYMKSGTLRQEPMLRSLMEDFLFTQDFSSAFLGWNQDLFHPNVGLDVERRSCRSRPGLPLFMVCVYGFTEFVEPLIANKGHVFYAENYEGERPLEIATLYGHYDTMVTLYNAASSIDISSIWAERWLEAAAQSRNLDIWNFVMEHNPSMPFASAMVMAVQDPLYGKDMVCNLLKNIININNENFAEILKGCASFEILHMLLARFSSVRFTESMLEASVQNPNINPELTEMVLFDYQNLRVSEICILSVFRGKYKSQGSAVAVLKVLLNHSIRCEISEEMIYKVAHVCQNKDVECLALLLQCCPIDHITEDLLVAAARNLNRGTALLEFFLNHTLGHRISQQVLQGAILDQQNAQRVMMLLSRPETPTVLEESLYIIMDRFSRDKGVFTTAMKACKSMHITDAYLQACVATRGLSGLKHVVYSPRAVPISKDALRTSTRNTRGAADVLEFLLLVKSGFELEISEDFLFQALSNYDDGPELVHVLADHWNGLPVTETSMMAAVKLGWNGTTTFEFLLEHCAPCKETLTDNVLRAAIEGDNIEFVEFFKHKRPDFQFKEKHLKAAINGHHTENAVLKFILSQQRRCPISKPVLDLAAQKEDQSILKLLLEEPGASDLLVKAMQDEADEADERVTFEAVQSAASTGAMPNEYSLELSTMQLELVLSKYKDPMLDTSRLVEAAAERGDGKFVVQYLLSRFPQTLVTRSALLAAASNKVAMTSLLDFLLQHYHAAIDPQLLQSAARNEYRGTQMVELLLAKCPADMEVERDVIVAAMSNHFCGRSLLDLFLTRQPDLEVAHDIVEAASENEVLSKVLLQMLLKQSLALCSTKSTDLVFSKLKSTVHGLRDSLFLAVCYQDDSILNFLISRDVSISKSLASSVLR